MTRDEVLNLCDVGDLVIIEFVTTQGYLMTLTAGKWLRIDHAVTVVEFDWMPRGRKPGEFSPGVLYKRDYYDWRGQLPYHRIQSIKNITRRINAWKSL